MWQVYVRPTSASDFFIANFYVLGIFMPKNKFRAKKIRVSRGVDYSALCLDPKLLDHMSISRKYTQLFHWYRCSSILFDEIVFEVALPLPSMT
jgi:hypothetical protein